MPTMGADDEFEVVRSDVEGWGVRRVGDPEALSHHDTREQAEEAARLHSDGGGVDVRGDVFAENPEQDVGPKRTFAAAGVITVAVIVLIIVVSLLVALTDFGG